MIAPALDHPAAALLHCEMVTRRRARNFYYGLKLLPQPQRSAMYAIYAWMRRADDLADELSENGEDQTARIEAFRADTAAALAGDPPDRNPIWTALAFAARRFEIDPIALHDMLDGQLDDVRERRYETFAELREYCYRVASTVGLVCITVWGYEDEAARDLAIDRGIAFQLTNILRDLREDFDGGRVYLPAEDFKRHGLTPRELREWAAPEKCQTMIAEQVARAQSFYDRSAPLDELINPACRPTIWAMTAIYRGLLEKIAANPQRLVGPHRVRLGSITKAMIAIRARWLAPPTPAPAPGSTVETAGNGSR